MNKTFTSHSPSRPPSGPPPRHRVYAEVSPALQKRLAKVLNRGDRQFLIETFLTEIVGHIESLEGDARTMFFGAVAQRKLKLSDFAPSVKEFSK